MRQGVIALSALAIMLCLAAAGAWLAVVAVDHTERVLPWALPAAGAVLVAGALYAALKSPRRQGDIKTLRQGREELSDAVRAIRPRE